MKVSVVRKMQVCAMRCGIDGMLDGDGSPLESYLVVVMVC